MSDSVECIVIGAGVIGLAVARGLAKSGREVLVIEPDDDIGKGMSSRSSEVIHAGLYYPKNSLKADLCTRGIRFLYNYLKEKGIPHKIVGKLVVAVTDDEINALKNLYACAVGNGITKLEIMSAERARALEPKLQCSAALFSPVTGIFDSHSYMAALRADAEDAGATFAFKTPFCSAYATGMRFHVKTGLGKAADTIQCQALVNAAGINAQSVASLISQVPKNSIPALHLSKGSYFSFSEPVPFSHLIYPLPSTEGLGIHFTMDMSDQGRFGPDSEWVDEASYDVDPKKREAFATEISTYFPTLRPRSLKPAYAGVRAKVQGPGNPPGDFIIHGMKEHGLRGLANLYGIESPGLTASLAIADYVVALCK
jgi:L-2-hydroxyglutarate oxidase LhgO